MHNRFGKYIWVISMITCLITCRKPYSPPAILANNNYLVVDGMINAEANSITTINLNRSRNLSDTATVGAPELNAQVSILGQDGSSYPLTDPESKGVYTSATLFLNTAQEYSINITTSDGKKYASDFVPCKQTPPIDSVYWQQPNDLTVYLSTHDPANKTIYYRWDYIETWAHDAQLQTAWGVSNGMIFATDSNTQKSNCWTTQQSTNILLGSSASLAQDVITQAPIITIPDGDPKIDKRYSILVRQYALTEDAFNYWQLIQKTSQKLGTLFDLQPSQLIGNIHSVTNPNEPVIGFISASSMQQQRIFIFNTYLTNWEHNPIVYSCDTTAIPVNPIDYRIYSYGDTAYAPYYFVTNGPLIVASKICLDCTLLGGTNKKPDFW